jgi:hypothetical protein
MEDCTVVWLYLLAAEDVLGLRPFGTAVRGDEVPPMSFRKDER